jgi:hypothetical protein
MIHPPDVPEMVGGKCGGRCCRRDKRVRFNFPKEKCHGCGEEGHRVRQCAKFRFGNSVGEKTGLQNMDWDNWVCPVGVGGSKDVKKGDLVLHFSGSRS